jgi:hypothetical protein
MPSGSWKSQKSTKIENSSIISHQHISTSIESYGIGANLHFLGFAHTVHVCPIGVGPILLVDMAIIVDAYHSALEIV